MQYSVNSNDLYLVNSLSWTSEKVSLSFQRLISKVIEESTLKISYDWKFCFVLWFSFDIILFFTDFYVSMQIVQTETVLLFVAFLFLLVNIANFVKLTYTWNCLFFHRFFLQIFLSITWLSYEQLWATAEWAASHIRCFTVRFIFWFLTWRPSEGSKFKYFLLKSLPAISGDDVLKKRISFHAYTDSLSCFK